MNKEKQEFEKGSETVQSSKVMGGVSRFDPQALQMEIAKAMQQIQDENDEKEKEEEVRNLLEEL